MNEEKKTKATTIYFPISLIQEIGETKNFNARIIDLVNKGLQYETSPEKVNFTKALGYFNAMYKKKFPNRELPI